MLSQRVSVVAAALVAIIVANAADPEIEPTTYGEHPFEVAVQERVGNEVKHICAGVLFREDWVITAAQCILSLKSIDNVRVYVAPGVVGKEVSSTIKEKFVNKLFKPDRQGAGTEDVALLQLNEPFINVPTAKLPEADSVPFGMATLIKWGDGSVDESNLQKVKLPILPFSECHAHMQRWSDRNKEENILAVTDVCTGEADEVNDQGEITKKGRQLPSPGRRDTGGALIQIDEGKRILIGIPTWNYAQTGEIPSTSSSTPTPKLSRVTSWRETQTEPIGPAVYTRVAACVDWIEDVLKHAAASPPQMIPPSLAPGSSSQAEFGASGSGGS